MFLEIATTIGTIVGASLTTMLPPAVIAVVLGGVLIFSSYLNIRRSRDNPDCVPDRLTARLRMEGTYPTTNGEKSYHARNVLGGFGLMSVAGLLSGLVGIGSGTLKVLAMDQIMCLPFTISPNVPRRIWRSYRLTSLNATSLPSFWTTAKWIQSMASGSR
jgi:hypothetical protein